MTEKEALILLSTFPTFTPNHLKLLLNYFETPLKIWEASLEELIKIGLRKEKAINFIKHKSSFNTLHKNEYFNRLNKLEIDTLTINDKSYPKNLKEIEDCPFVLYVKGKLKEKDEKAIAVIGSRKMTNYGKSTVFKIVSDLVKRKVTIVSGLARGVDTEAHKTTINSSGRTLAVLGSGLDFIYPPENKILSEEIVKRGALISEYPLGYPPFPQNFLQRNRIVAALSKGVLVIEGAERSGTLVTASYAANYGRNVFAVPGDISSPLSFAPNFLIKNGAKVITEGEDILEEL
jgi:DNA processing protein